jgi:pyrroloquinoline quinone biosynthesis protein D
VTTSVNHADIFALAKHYRFQWEEAQGCYVLLFPEGMVKLNGGAGEVLKRIDGTKSVGDVVQELEATFPGVPDLQSDILAMFDLALEKVWIEKVN